MPKNNEQWAFVTQGAKTLLLLKSSSGDFRTPTEDEAHQACSYLNDQHSYIVTLYCRTPDCKDKGAWIRRGTDDVKKNVYTCEICKQPMVR